MIASSRFGIIPLSIRSRNFENNVILTKILSQASVRLIRIDDVWCRDIRFGFALAAAAAAAASRRLVSRLYKLRQQPVVSESLEALLIYRQYLS